MLQFCRSVFFVTYLLFLHDQAQCDNQTIDASVTSQAEGSSENVETEESSGYDELTPIIGWNRYSGDSARSIKGWFRWWKYLCLKEPVVIDWIQGLKLKVYPGNEIFRSIFVRGIYDPNLIVITNTLLRKGGTFIEAGSNMGHFALLASRVVGEKGRIYAMEPSTRDFNRLSDNIRINNLQKIIHPYKVAISDKSGRTKLSIACEERSALNTLGKEFGLKGVEKINVEDVDLTTIDEFVRRQRINEVSVLKLDIEGSELGALRGARNTIEKYRPAIVLGVNADTLKACGSSLDEVQKMMSELRYCVYKVVESPKFSLEQITNIFKSHVKVVFCLHESIVPPVLPQPKNDSIINKVSDFFLR